MLLILAVVGQAVAQPKPPPNRREQIKKRIRILRSATLTEELALDETTAGKLFPLLAKYDDELDKLLQTKVDIARKLEAPPADAKATNQVIDDAIANQKALWSSEERRLGELRKILTPAQVAKLLVVLPALERKIQNQLRKAIENANRPPAEDGDFDPDEGRTPPPGKRPR
jgi:hypothetical protein